MFKIKINFISVSKKLCAGSICEKHNMTQCYLEGNVKDKNTDKERLCHLACQGGTYSDKSMFFIKTKFNFIGLTNNICVDSFTIDTLYNPKRNSSGFLIFLKKFLLFF